MELKKENRHFLETGNKRSLFYENGQRVTMLTTGAYKKVWLRKIEIKRNPKTGDEDNFFITLSGAVAEPLELTLTTSFVTINCDFQFFLIKYLGLDNTNIPSYAKTWLPHLFLALDLDMAQFLKEEVIQVNKLIECTLIFKDSFPVPGYPEKKLKDNKEHLYDDFIYAGLANTSSKESESLNQDFNAAVKEEGEEEVPY